MNDERMYDMNRHEQTNTIKISTRVQIKRENRYRDSKWEAEKKYFEVIKIWNEILLPYQIKNNVECIWPENSIPTW
jgi:hypothetical protein